MPRGSFYNYFESKEAFALAVVDQFAACHDAELDRAFADRSRPPLERFWAYFEGLTARIERDGCRKGCLLGNLGQEMSAQSEILRARLEQAFSRWVHRLADCLEEARAAGDLSERACSAELAEFVLNSWQGAILRAKTTRSVAPLRLFLKMTRNVPLGEPPLARRLRARRGESR